MLIVSIKQTSPGRLTLGLEDGSDIKTTLGVVTDFRLFQGRDEDEAQIEQIKLSSARALARERALELVSRSFMSRKQLRDKLVRKGEPDEIADYCVQWLEENGFINDENYAASVARHYTAKGYGAGRIRAELSRRGVERELWDGAVEAVSGSNEEIDKLISKRLKDPADRDEVRKLGASLYRRGFSWEEIRQAFARRDADAFED